MQIRLLSRPGLLVGGAVVGLSFWLARANRPLEAGSHQNPESRPISSLRTISVTVGIDTQLSAEGAGDVFESCGLSKSNPASGLFDGKAVKTRSSESHVAAFGVSNGDSAAVCIANRSDAPAALKVGIRLRRGAYAIERRTVEGQAETSGRLEGLQSVYMDRPGWLWRTSRLEPGQLAIYRFVNRSAELQTAYRSLAKSMRNLKREQPHDYRLLASAVSICESNVAALAQGTRKGDRFRMLRYIHRALLAVGQAQAFSRNAAGDGNVQVSIDRFEDSLANLSAALLTLVPSLDIATGTDSQARKVTVKLTNCGQRSIGNVRMGVQTPHGGRVWPGERAMFGSVKPGECARATFSVRFPEADSTPRIGAEITYFVANAPARLRVESSL